MLLFCEFNLLVLQSVKRFHVVKYFVIGDLQSAFHTQFIGIFIFYEHIKFHACKYKQ